MQYNSEAWNWRKLYFDAKVNYDRTFGNHRVGGLLFYYLESTTESGADSSMNAIARRYQSLSGRFTYGFKDTYFLDVNFGLNGSENFQSGRQYGFFPAVAVGWVPTQYEFMKRIKWIDFMKIRASYGMVGNDRISSVRFPYLTIIEEKTDGTPWGGSGVLTENRVGADNLAWEKAKKFDIGMDLHLFGDRFTMTVDYFRDRREGIFQERAQIPDYVGVISMPYGNVGSMTSWGGDGNFEYFQPLGKNFHFTLRGNFTLSKNKINNWEEATQPYPYLSKTGFSNDVQRGFISLGLFKDQQDVDMSPEQFGTVRPGDIKYKDVNGDGVITDDDKVPLFAYSGIPGSSCTDSAPKSATRTGRSTSCSKARATTISSTGTRTARNSTVTFPSTADTRATYWPWPTIRPTAGLRPTTRATGRPRTPMRGSRAFPTATTPTTPNPRPSGKAMPAICACRS